MISITLPSIFPDCLERTLENLETSSVGEIEIVVCAPFSVSHPRVKWVQDTELVGCNAGHERAFREATGEFVVAWVDDHLLTHGWDAIAEEDFRECESRARRPFLMGLRQTSPLQIGTVFGHYYPYFPMMRTEEARSVGWFDGSYRMDFADCDLAMRVLAAGGSAGWARESSVVVHRDDARKSGREFCVADMDRFVARWAPMLGAGWSTSDIRGFNLDVDLTLLQEQWIDDRIEIVGRSARPSGKRRAA